MNNSKISVAFYIRVSSEGQANIGHGIEIQKSFCDQIANTMNWTCYKTYFHPGSISGDTEVTSRPEFIDMLQDAKNNKFEIVVIQQIDRLGRLKKVVVDAFDILFRLGLKVYVKDMFLENTSEGRSIIESLAQSAESDKKQNLQRMAAGLEKLTIERGEKQGPLPYGYRRSGKGKKLKIETVEYEVDTIKKIYELRRNGLSQQKIADTLNQNGLTPRQKNYWSQRTISRILSPKRQAIYTGSMRNDFNELGICWPKILNEEDLIQNNEDNDEDEENSDEIRKMLKIKEIKEIDKKYFSGPISDSPLPQLKRKLPPLLEKLEVFAI